MPAWTTVDWARDGDPSYLLARLRDPKCTPTMSEREYIADLIEGRIKRPAHRKTRCGHWSDS